MRELKKGDFVQFDGLPAVVVGIAGEPNVPDDHVALWFGAQGVKRKSEGGSGDVAPEVWTVPVDLCDDCIPAKFNH